MSRWKISLVLINSPYSALILSRKELSVGVFSKILRNSLNFSLLTLTWSEAEKYALKLRLHRSGVKHCCYSRDGSEVLSCSEDGDVKVCRMHVRLYSGTSVLCIDLFWSPEVYTQTHTHMHAHTHIHTFTLTHTCGLTHTHGHMYTHQHTQTHTQIHTDTHTYTRTVY